MDAVTLAIRALRGIGSATWITARAGTGMWRRASARDPLVAPALAADLTAFLWRPLPTLVALSALTGIIAGISASRLLAIYHAELPVLRTLFDALFRHVLPLVLGTFGASGVAVALATRLGAMSLAREIDALETMGHDPVQFALAPSLVAVLASVPLQVLVGATGAALGAALPLHLVANVPWHLIGGIAVAQPALAALAMGMSKAFVFALLAFMAGAATGAHHIGTPAALGGLGVRAFTHGLLTIFVADALWTALA